MRITQFSLTSRLEKIRERKRKRDGDGPVKILRARVKKGEEVRIWKIQEKRRDNAKGNCDLENF